MADLKRPSSLSRPSSDVVPIDPEIPYLSNSEAFRLTTVKPSTTTLFFMITSRARVVEYIRRSAIALQWEEEGVPGHLRREKVIDIDDRKAEP